VRWRDRLLKTTTLVLGGPVVLRDEPERHVRVGFPLFWRFSYPGAHESTTVVLPLFVRHRSSDGSHTTVLLPTYFRRSPQGWSAALMPALFFGSSRAGHHAVVFPVFWHVTSTREGASTTVALPFFHARSERGHVTGLLPLFVAGSWGGARFAVALPPLFQYVAGPEPGRSVLLAGLYLQQRHHGYRRDAVLPLFFRSRRVLAEGVRTRTTLLPLFHLEESPGRRLLFTPLGGYSRDLRTQSSRGLWGPVAWWRTPARRGLTVLPLYWQWRHDGPVDGDRTALLFPLYLHHRDSDGVAADVAFPLVWSFSDRTRRTSTLLALPFLHRRTPESRTLAALPLLWASWGRARWTALFPLFYHHADAERSGLHTPLFGYERSEGSLTWYALPYLQRRSSRGSFDALLPLFAYRHERSSDTRTLFLLPGYLGRSRPGASFHALFPLVWRATHAGRSATVVAPVLWDLAEAGRGRTTLVLPLVLRRHDEEERSTLVAVAPGVWVRRHPGGTDGGLFPLLWHHRDDRAKRHTTVAFPLFWDLRRGEERRTVFFPVFWRFEGPERTTHVVLNTYYQRDKRQGTFDLNIIPLVRVARKRPQDLRLDLLAGLFGYERIGRNRYLKLFLIPIGLPALPAQPAALPAQPAALPAQPAALPALPAQPAALPALPAQPAALPAQPAARPAQPAARPAQPAALPAQPAVRPAALPAFSPPSTASRQVAQARALVPSKSPPGHWRSRTTGRHHRPSAHWRSRTICAWREA